MKSQVMFPDHTPNHFIDSYSSISEDDKDTIKRYTSKYPVDLESITKNLKIKVFYESMDWGISGKITEIRGEYFISINKVDHPYRQRFTLGHEIGHYILHKKLIDSNGITDNTMYRSDTITTRQDTEANRFSAKLLMPMELIEELREENTNVSYIANKLQVSEQALYIRLGIPLT